MIAVNIADPAILKLPSKALQAPAVLGNNITPLAKAFGNIKAFSPTIMNRILVSESVLCMYDDEIADSAVSIIFNPITSNNLFLIEK